MTLSPEADALFDSLVVEPERDQYGRPLLVPGGKHVMPLQPRKPRSDGKVPYTRASSLGNYVSDHTALDTWKQRSLTKGLGDREDLAAMAAALPPIFGNTRDKKGMSQQEVVSDKLTNATLDEIAEQAMQHANCDYKAAWGTAVHGFTDPGASGQVPERMAADVASWFEATKGWNFLLTEAFVANDELQSAGTFDHLVEIPWRPDLGALVVDKKTGLLHPDQFCVQLDVYARGELYDVATDTRRPWPVRPNRDWALLAHIPLGLGRTDIYLVDLVAGHEAALVATKVRAHRMDKEILQPVDFAAQGRLHVAGLIADVDCKDTLLSVHRAYEALWTNDLTALGRQRLTELAS